MARRFVTGLFQRGPHDLPSHSSEGDLSTTAISLLLFDDSFWVDVNRDKQPYSFHWTTILWSKLQAAISSWLNTYVIHKSSGEVHEWHFRTLFVAEVTILPFVLMFGLVSFWLLNRNTHLHKTKGSAIPLKVEENAGVARHDDNDDDEEDDVTMQVGDDDKTAKPSALKVPPRMPDSSRRQAIHAMLKAYDVERDDDEAGLEESDYEDPPARLSNLSASVSYSKPESITESDASTVFLSSEKRGLWKIVKEIPVFSYFNEEAIQICMEFVEYVDLKVCGDTLWTQNGYDGSLYYVVSGGVRVHFHDFEAPSSDQRERGSVGTEFQKQKHTKDPTPATFIHEAGTVVTSLLSSLEGMVQRHLKGKNRLGRFVGAAMRQTSARAASDGTRLLRVPPDCFCRVLDRFPDTVLRIIQAVLNRTQRVTVQTLVRTCGLREELLVQPSKELRNCMLPKKDWSSPWNSVQSVLEKNVQSQSDLESLSATCMKRLMKNSCTLLLTMLGVEDRPTAEVLEEQCSLLVMDDRGDQGCRILQEAGTVHDACYLLLQGSLEMGVHVPIRGYTKKQLQKDPRAWRFKRFELILPGTIFGESACFTTDINLFEVRCVTDQSSSTEKKSVVLLRIPTEIFTQLIVKHPQAMTLSLASVLCVLSPVVHLLTWGSEWMHVDAAEEVVQKGTPCNSVFVVLNGRLRAGNRSKARHRAQERQSSNVIPPEEFGRGKILGEVGSLAGSKWPYDVFAIRQSELAKVPVKILEIVVQNYPSAGLFLARVVASHVESLYNSKRQMQNDYADNHRRMDFEPSSSNGTVISDGRRPQSLPNSLPSYGLRLATIAVVPLTYSVDISLFCDILVSAMQSIAPCKLLTKSIVKKELGQKVYQTRNALNDLKLTRMLGDMEENNRVVVYKADPKCTFWTRLCIQQADCILLVVDANRAPESSRVEQTLAWAYESMDVRIDLVVIGEPKAEEYNELEYDNAGYFEEDDIDVSDQLNNWSESRRWISGHHLVRAPFDRFRMDFSRMCRRVTGRAVGLVLGGGGARGLAHLGVIRALKEAGVTVDMVGGTSQGAFCGALFARYPDDYEQVLRASREMAAEMSDVKTKLFDLTLPMASMFSGRRFNRGIRKLLGNLRIQDLVLNFFCVSVDLQKQTTVVHTKGLLWKYVRASMTLAGYLPPIAENGSLLVDGGYLNAVPADVMRYKMGARTVIAVDVSPDNERLYFEYGTHLSGWWLLWNSWNPFVKTVNVPSMGDISEMLIWVSSEQHRRAVKSCSDLHLTPPIQHIGTLEYDKFDEIVEKSYEYAKPVVDEWVRRNPWMVSPRLAKSHIKDGQKNICDLRA